MQTSVLLHRIENGRTDLVEPLLASPDARSVVQEHGVRLIVWCSYFGDATACRLLLKHGDLLIFLGPNLGRNGAAFHGHWQLCEFLLESGRIRAMRIPLLARRRCTQHSPTMTVFATTWS